jgi:hypothetical protein
VTLETSSWEPQRSFRSQEAQKYFPKNIFSKNILASLLSSATFLYHDDPFFLSIQAFTKPEQHKHSFMVGFALVITMEKTTKAANFIT